MSERPLNTGRHCSGSLLSCHPVPSPDVPPAPAATLGCCQSRSGQGTLLLPVGCQALGQLSMRVSPSLPLHRVEKPSHRSGWSLWSKPGQAQGIPSPLVVHMGTPSHWEQISSPAWGLGATSCALRHHRSSPLSQSMRGSVRPRSLPGTGLCHSPTHDTPQIWGHLSKPPCTGSPGHGAQTVPSYPHGTHSEQSCFPAALTSLTAPGRTRVVGNGGWGSGVGASPVRHLRAPQAGHGLLQVLPKVQHILHCPLPLGLRVCGETRRWL